ncbi:hypothetical protein [Pseudaminobacter soli (ex Zhang et al. 2022)]|uniref:hypothetical protein n=1 Tax=Pseudaminobacter soli (ex Zhang et al. 2022) TaxID=2831468 RepID=UPI001F4697B4|nr:hypothetical protein [Pseudaminobacter soli]
MGAGFSQIGNPAGLAPNTVIEQPGVPAPGQSNYQDNLFAQLALPEELPKSSSASSLPRRLAMMR